MNQSVFYPVPIKTALCFSHRLNGTEDLTYCRLSIWQTADDLTFSLQCFEAVPDPRCRFYLCAEGSHPVQWDFSFCDENLPLGSLSRYGSEDLEGTYWGADLTVPLSSIKNNSCPAFSIKYEGAGQCSSPFPDGTLELCLI